ncbi:hypothetical protein KUCAC02_007996, partial [Chaenocephalus aceratus]
WEPVLLQRERWRKDGEGEKDRLERVRKMDGWAAASSTARHPPPSPPLCTANHSVPAPMFPPSSNNQEPSDMAASNIHNSHTATRGSLLR